MSSKMPHEARHLADEESSITSGDDSGEDRGRLGPRSRGALVAIMLVSVVGLVVALACMQPVREALHSAGSKMQGALLASQKEEIVGAPVFRGRNPIGPQVENLKDCWEPCGGAGMCPSFCGEDKACCKKGEATEMAVCQGAEYPNVSTAGYHICVTVSSAFATVASPPAVEPAALLGAAPLLGALPTAAADALTESASAEPLVSVGRSALPRAPVHTFYLYRAQGDVEYPLGNINVGNLPGVLWYLENEVMPRCPKRYHITRIKRMIMTTRATPELYARGMNWGVRYSYDAGRCTGSNIRLLGSCDRTWKRFGYVPGCNNFRDHYPYPLFDTEYPDGKWYDFPVEGRCDHPTGSWNCTWSYKDAGEVKLSDLEAKSPGWAYCCQGNCTNFWLGKGIRSSCDQRLNMVRDMFAKKYPDMPPDMPEPPCDFKRDEFWREDTATTV